MCTFYRQGSIFNKMKFIITVFISTFLMAGNYALSGPLDKFERGLDKITAPAHRGLNKLFNQERELDKTPSKSSTSLPCKTNNFFERGLDKLMAPVHSGINKAFNIEKKPCANKEVVKRNTNPSKNFSYKNDNPQNISFYTGTFDTIDKEGDDKTTLMGVEHKNKDLFRNTWIGRFSPTTGAFVTKKNSIYLYTGIEADYNLGPINISPSFAPGYYEAGNGKNLGSALEFKSEIKIGVDLFKNTNLGYSYSHISNNDWGDVNPGSDNQSITFSKKY
jgi:lipid A 3-O-deacylase